MDEQVRSKAKPREPKPAPKPESTKHLRVLSNGAVYDMNKKRIVNSKAVTTKITKENAVALQSRQQELKRAALVRAANAVAEQGGGVDGRQMQGDMAYVEAIGEAMTMKALTVNDPKAVDAARFIFQETGISEAQAQPERTNRDAASVLVALMVQYAKNAGLLTETGISVSDNPVNDAHSIVDGEVTDGSPTDQEPNG